jgi:hypothetical protein
MRPTRVRLVTLGIAIMSAAALAACGSKKPLTPTTPSDTQSSNNSSAPTLAAPAAKSPVGGALTDSRKPSLTVTNAAASGNVGTVTYQFEVSEVNSFPADSRSSSVSGVAQGDGSTSWQPPSELIPGFTYYWHARATNGSITTDWSKTETFQTP